MSKVKPFSSGSQFDDWEASNCHKCKYYELGNCDIALALIFAYWDDGTVSQEIANRMGYVKDKYVWQCTEVNWIEELVKEF